MPTWLYLTPGIYTLLLAVVAGVVPTLKFYERRWVKITYTCRARGVVSTGSCVYSEGPRNSG
jgi:hypothetical protein